VSQPVVLAEHAAQAFMQRGFYGATLSAGEYNHRAVAAARHAVEQLRLADSRSPAESPVGGGRSLPPAPPRYTIDPYEGPASAATYMFVEPRGEQPAYVAISHAAPVFTVMDELYVNHSSSSPDDRAWDGEQLAIQLDRPPWSEILAALSRALAGEGFRYVDLNDPALDEPAPVRDLPGGTVRDLVFNFDQYT
jgi:hypothetical protein